MDGCVKTFGPQTMRERAEKNAMERGCVSKRLLAVENIFKFVYFQCIAECILNGTGHADLSEANMVEVDLAEAKAMGMDADWEPVIRAAAKMCADEGLKQASRFEEGFKLAPVDPNDTVCHPKFVFSLVCTTMQYVMVRKRTLFLSCLVTFLRSKLFSELSRQILHRVEGVHGSEGAFQDM